MDNDNQQEKQKKGYFDLPYWSGIASLTGLPITFITAYWSGSKKITIGVFCLTSFLFFSIWVYSKIKTYIEKVKEKAVNDAGRLAFENPYQKDFETISNHLVLDMISQNKVLVKQTREVLCKRDGANEYYYRHGPAKHVKEFRHNIGTIISEQVNQGRLDIIVRLDYPHRRHQKRVFISDCKFTAMYPTAKEEHVQLKHYSGSEFGSYTLIFPANKPPMSYYSKIIVRDNHLQPKDTKNCFIQNERSDGRIELYLPIEEYELNVGDKISLNWEW